nr:MAG TPA: PlyB-like endolysin [Caudoviricetes sp.]
MAKIIGIDVSEHNGVVNWPAAKKAGIGFAVIRTGYGTSHTDYQWKNNIEGALAQGIPVGIYHFSYALTAAGAKAEADFVLSLLAPYKGKITLPVFFDFEYDTVDYAKKQGVTLGASAFNAHTVAFCERIKSAGYTAGTYYNLDYLRRYVDMDTISGYVRWYAQYSSTPSASGHDIWQYSSSYTIPGCSGRFDVNLLENTALLGKRYTVGWHKDDKGWWYADSATTYVRDSWKEINNKWYYFDSEGYMMASSWRYNNGDYYYLGADGAMSRNMLVGVDSTGKMVPMEPWYHTLGDVPKKYRSELDILISAGKLKGKSGSGENLVLDLPESAVRVMIVANR